ncbi:hypothetical protein Tco_0681613 [Tanacetum coccineum]|uniref:Retrovirus-related Pol polyprotein from transposon TNT 1-94-like beta-barrel domain-containing protein n=1 Tax=Tanacetum coccineum TaxID=301880 RepID=A0ABQ4XP44_9ASTR
MAPATHDQNHLPPNLPTSHGGNYTLAILLNPIHLRDEDKGLMVEIIGLDSSVNESEEDNNQVNARYKAGKGYHAVLPPYTGNYMPPRPDMSFTGLDDYVFKSTVSETITSVHETETSASKTSKERMEEPKTVRSSAPLIEEQAENLRKSQNSRVDKRNWNGIMTQKLGDGFEFKKKACFVYESPNHLIKDCNFYENKMVGKSVLNNEGKVTGQREIRPQSSPRAATSISIVRPVNTAAPKPKLKNELPTTYSYFKAHSPIRRAFNQKSVAKPNNFNEKVNTAWVNNVTTTGPKAVVSAAKGNGENAGNSQHALKDHGIVDSGCSRHMTGNKAYLSNYQEVDGGFVAFGGSSKGGKFEGKADEGFLVGYSVNRSGLEWLFDIDSLTKSMNYELVTARNQTNGDAVKEIKIPNINNASPIPNDPNMTTLEDTGIFDGAYDDEDEGAEANLNNLETTKQSFLSNN